MNLSRRNVVRGIGAAAVLAVLPWAKAKALAPCPKCIEAREELWARYPELRKRTDPFYCIWCEYGYWTRPYWWNDAKHGAKPREWTSEWVAARCAQRAREIEAEGQAGLARCETLMKLARGESVKLADFFDGVMLEAEA